MTTGAALSTVICTTLRQNSAFPQHAANKGAHASSHTAVSYANSDLMQQGLTRIYARGERRDVGLCENIDGT
jgi:hypothetical protein